MVVERILSDAVNANVKCHRTPRVVYLTDGQFCGTLARRAL